MESAFSRAWESIDEQDPTRQHEIPEHEPPISYVDIFSDASFQREHIMTYKPQKWKAKIENGINQTRQKPRQSAIQ